jgi:hypothetical protein
VKQTGTISVGPGILSRNTPSRAKDSALQMRILADALGLLEAFRLRSGADLRVTRCVSSRGPRATDAPAVLTPRASCRTRNCSPSGARPDLSMRNSAPIFKIKRYSASI